jgi:hypothetical protein
MPNNLRQFTRFRSNSFCLIESESCLVKALFVDYSQMGALLRIDKMVAARKHLALIYPNEKADFVKMAGYSVHTFEKNGLYYLGVQFIALISR